MTQHEARMSNAVVEGTITLSGHIAQTILDLGVTHLFTSNAFANKLNKSSEPLHIQLIISTPLETEVVSRTK